MAVLFSIFGLRSLNVSPASAVQDQMMHGKKIEPKKRSDMAIGASLTESNSAAQPTLQNNSSPGPSELVSASGDKYICVSFARLSSFNYKPVETTSNSEASDPASAKTDRPLFPNTVKILAEKQVAVTGFILPTKLVEGRAVEFLLLKNQSACCYGVMPRVNEWVVVHTAGKGIQPLMDVPVTALGTLHVGEVRDNGQLAGIYQLDLDEIVKAKE